MTFNTETTTFVIGVALSGHRLVPHRAQLAAVRLALAADGGQCNAGGDRKIR